MHEREGRDRPGCTFSEMTRSLGAENSWARDDVVATVGLYEAMVSEYLAGQEDEVKRNGQRKAPAASFGVRMQTAHQGRRVMR